MKNIDCFPPQTGRTLKENDVTVNVANKIGEMLGQDGGIWIADTVAHVPTTGKVYSY